MDILSNKNHLAAKILKAEILGKNEATSKSKEDLRRLEKDDFITDHNETERTDSKDRVTIASNKFTSLHEDDMTAQELLVAERQSCSADETKRFLQYSAKLGNDSGDSRQFSEEFDDSQRLLKSKRMKLESLSHIIRKDYVSKDEKICDKCKEQVPRHLIIANGKRIFTGLSPSKSIFRKGYIVIRNLRHDASCYLESDEETRREIELVVNSLSKMWNDHGYGIVIMESYYKNFTRGRGSHLISAVNHFQIYCIPLKSKIIEDSRIHFKQALLESEKEWSMNKKLITVCDKKIDHFLPQANLPYFWVCFEKLTKGFAHVIENEETFSKYFGLEVIAGLLNKDPNDVRYPRKESNEEQFERAREMKTMWTNVDPFS